MGEVDVDLPPSRPYSQVIRQMVHVEDLDRWVRILEYALLVPGMGEGKRARLGVTQMTITVESVIRLLQDAVERNNWEQAARVSLLLHDEFRKMQESSQTERYKIEWIDAHGDGHDDLFDDLVTAYDFLNLIRDLCCMADAYERIGGEWVHL